jgi:uncharacterized membrane protein YfcA
VTNANEGGGIVGSLIGARANAKLWPHKRALSGIFASVVIAVGLYVAVKGVTAVLAIT